MDGMIDNVDMLRRVPRWACEGRRLFVVEVRLRRVRMDISIHDSLTPDEIALLRHFVRTLQNWEQGHRNPTGPAVALLKIVASAPDVAVRALRA